MRALLALLALPLLAQGAMAASVSDTRPVPARGSGEDPFYELNLDGVTSGETLSWSWGTRSAGVLTYDVHWHDGQVIRTLVGPMRDSAGGDGKFTVPATRNVSFLWENKGPAAVTISFEIKTVTEEKSFLPNAPLAAVAAVVLASLALRVAPRR